MYKVQMDLKLMIPVPTDEEIQDMALEDLKAWAKRLESTYYKRFRFRSHADYVKIIRFRAIEERIREGERIETGQVLDHAGIAELL